MSDIYHKLYFMKPFDLFRCIENSMHIAKFYPTPIMIGHLYVSHVRVNLVLNYNDYNGLSDTCVVKCFRTPPPSEQTFVVSGRTYKKNQNLHEVIDFL